MNTSMIGFYISDVCELYSVLPSEIDEDSLKLIEDDLSQLCMAMYGKRAFIYEALEVVE